MRFVTCSSYYGTGSSAITDFVSEFRGVFPFIDSEFRFIQDPDGISDLEFNLVECFNRHNSGHALKRYKKLVDFYCGNLFGKKYSAFFGDKWKTISYEYIQNLTDFTYRGWWLYDLYDKGELYHFRKRIVNKALHKTVWKDKPELTFNSMKDEITYCSHPSEETFLRLTREYIYKLFSSVVPEGNDILLVDQLLPPSNLDRYLRYFDDNIQTVIVDRDPRDVFILEKYFWKDGMIPTDAETFCKWFRYTRSHRDNENMDSEQVKLVRFEDLIFKYQETTDQLINWLGLKKEDHVRPRSVFDPAQSVKNTRTWRRIPDCAEEVRYIRENLKEYLYPFPRKKAMETE